MKYALGLNPSEKLPWRVYTYESDHVCSATVLRAFAREADALAYILQLHNAGSGGGASVIYTAAQSSVLEAIERLTRERGIPPTLHEVAHDLARADATISYHVARLRSLGALAVERGLRRTLRIIVREQIA